ncbi:EamA family transporter [Glaciihabitans sp. INWT7]|uniref:EamA family transporter n=1 Tax=Glaciihabitans sp. INWT7 TaxID=2596912 RepID=UPI00162471D2|nr:EamA family transporter [Glaciihabitans sp. INWT7]
MSNFTTVLLLASPAALLVAVVAALVRPGNVSVAGIVWGTVAGIVGGAALPVAYRALARGPIGVVASVIACTSTVALGVAGIVTDGPPPLVVWAGMALSVIAIVLFAERPRKASKAETADPTSELRSAVSMAIIAGLGFAGFTFLMSIAQRDDNGPWSLVAARTAVLAVAVSLPFITGPVTRPTWKVSATSLSAGVLDVTGNLLLLAALATTPLITVAIIGATSPGIAALGAALLLRERLNRYQILGLILAAGGAALAAGA